MSGEEPVPAPGTLSHGTGAHRRTALRAGVAIAVAAAAFALFRLVALHVVAPNSDNATIVLEGAALRSGNVGLHGWVLSLDSFWTLDAPLYALGASILGLRPGLMADVPALIAAAVLLAAGALAGSGLGRSGRAVAFGVVALGLLGAPVAFQQFFLAGPYHVVTLLVCLGVFALLADAGLARGVAAVVLLVLGLLGDLQTLLLGVGPVLLVGVLELCRKHRRSALRLGVVGVTSVLLAEAVGLVLRAAGGFRLAKANTAASGHQLLRNLEHLPGYLASLFGVTTSPFGPSPAGALPLRGAHALGLGLGLVAVVVVGIGAWRRIERPGPETGPDAAATRRAELLAAGVVFDLGCFVVLPIITSPAYGRYLTAGVVEALVLGGALAGRLVEGAEGDGAGFGRRIGARELRRVGAAVGVLALAAYLATLVDAAGAPAPAAPAVALARALEHDGLRSGVGDYWSATLTTLDSDGAVAVRPVIAEPDGRLVRYGKQSTAAWYAGRRFSFFVYNTALPWNGDTPEAARRSFGHVVRTEVVGSYRVLVFARPFRVSPRGYEGP